MGKQHQAIRSWTDLASAGSTDSDDGSSSRKRSEADASSLGDTGDLGYNKALFRAASRYIHPGPLFRFIVYLYSERKLLVFFWFHFIATMIIWAHFGLIKFEEQKSSVPEGAPFYWWKRIAPPLEFGSMHAILFQMALIPITMSRYSIAALSGTVIDQFVPLNRAVRIHIHLGYVMISIVFFATIFFFIFFGILCAGGDEAFCDKFTSEIMCTGYGILASLLIIGGTSYFRHRIPYEVFYAVHHLVFAMYAITIAHTFDSVQRSGERNRSQTIKWFSSTLLWYVCDRMAMRLNHCYRAKLISATAVTGSDDSRMLLIKMQRPVLFQFKPGQYAFLKQSSIDAHWHPFSIASSPSSRFLEFYIEVFSPNTWTGKLWDLLKKGVDPLNGCSVELDVLGPYGTNLAKSENFSHGLVIGAGTGIVPVLSMFKQHIRNVLRLSPSEYFAESEENDRLQMEYEVARDARKGSFVQRWVALWRSRERNEELHGLTKRDFMQRSIRKTIGNLQDDGGSHKKQRDTKMLKWAAYEVTRSIYGVLFLALLSILGVTVLGITISWNTMPVILYERMTVTLKVLTIVFQACFAVPALLVWDGNTFFAFIDFAVCLVAVPADYFWFQKYNEHGVLSGVQIVLFCLHAGYMNARLWVRTVCPRGDHSNVIVGGMKRLEVIWVTRSASLVSEILPDISALWDSVVAAWGDDAHKVCRVSIYCTDQNQSSVEQLKADVATTSLFEQGNVHFRRPEFDELIEDHTLELIDECRTSNTLLAFCGSPRLAETIHQYQVSNYMLAAVTGHKKHQMEFISESYGGVRKTKAKENASDNDLSRVAMMSDNDGAPRRRRVSFSFGHDDEAKNVAGYLQSSTPGTLSQL